MKKFASFSRAAGSAFILLATIGAGTIAAQHMISSKAGFVNRVEGKVYLTRPESQEEEKAILGTQMNEGDRLSTEAGSYAELLLNPGSYIRVNENSEIRAVNTDLTRVRFELIRGSAMIEVGEVEKKEPVEIITPQGSFFIKKKGLQRLDVGEGMTRVAVRQGEIQLGTLDEVLNNKSRQIGRGKIAQLTGEQPPELAKIDEDAIDEFDKWSFNRAELLMAANQRALNNSSQNKSSLAYGWLFDPYHQFYTYIPRGSFWSPYGFGFFNSFNSCWDCYFPPVGYSYGYAGRPSPRVVSGIDRGPIRRAIEGSHGSGSLASPGSSSRGGGPHHQSGGSHSGGGWHGHGGASGGAHSRSK